MLWPRLMSRMPHKSQTTAAPTDMNVNSPTILHPNVHARDAPVASSQSHHCCENSRYRCWWNLM